MSEKVIIGTSTATGAAYTIGGQNIDARSFTKIRNSVLADAPIAEDKDLTALENAIYGHIRALRALGRETVNTLEIARALGVSLEAVDKAIANLRAKGVRRFGG